ncbi:MAG: HAD hydrolase-like protein [Desulfobacterales bacterium]|nr:HAD hydrolase-like protein [Desulfobacterales bacterium]
MNKMAAPYLLFDLDGTLSDPLQGIARSINYALGAFGYPTEPEADLARFIGPPLDKTFALLAGTGSEDHIRELVTKFRERFGDIGYKENTLYPGIPPVLEQLKERGVPMAVCTSKRADFAQKIISMFDLDPYFEFVSGGDIGISKGQQIQGLVGQDRISRSSIMIGDRDVDIIAARENSLPACGVLWGYGSREELESENPEYLVTTPDELEALS